MEHVEEYDTPGTIYVIALPASAFEMFSKASGAFIVTMDAGNATSAGGGGAGGVTGRRLHAQSGKCTEAPTLTVRESTGIWPWLAHCSFTMCSFVKRHGCGGHTHHVAATTLYSWVGLCLTP